VAGRGGTRLLIMGGTTGEEDSVHTARGIPARERWGWIVTALGLATILWGVLHLTNATVGGRVHSFQERRTYSQVKVAAHRAFPVTLLLGFAGIGLVFLGGKLRASGRREGHGT
jgi:hypothetical protein